MCIKLQEFFEVCCHLNVRLLHCGDRSSPCPAAKINVYTEYQTNRSCVYCCIGVRTRSAIAALRKDITLIPDVSQVPDEDLERIREEWRKNIITLQQKCRLRGDFMIPMEVEDIDTERRQCTYCWRQYDGKGDDCCENPRKLFCGHVFGRRCILEWLFSSGKHWCPTCRKSFENPKDTQRRNKRHGMIIESMAWTAMLNEQGGLGDNFDENLNNVVVTLEEQTTD